MRIPWPCWLVLVLVCLSWMPYLQVISNRLSFGDEGQTAQSAYLVYQGQIPYRDFFSVLMPGSYYWSAFLFKLCGPSFMTLRTGVVLVSLVLLVATWLVLARSGVRSLLAYMIPAGFLAYFGGPCWFIASHHWLSGALCMVSLAFLLPDDGAEVPSLTALGTAGIISSLAVLTLHHRGGLWALFASAALLLLPRKVRLRSLAAYWSGAAFIAVPAAAYLITRAGWKTVYYDLIIFPLTRYHNLEGHRGTVFKHLGEYWQTLSSAVRYISEPLGLLRLVAWDLEFLGLIVVHLLPFIGLFLLWRLWKGRAYGVYRVGCLGVFFVSSYLATLHRLSSSTLTFAAPAAVIIIALAFDATKRHTGVHFPAARVLAGVWVLIFSATSVTYSAFTLMSPKASVSTPAGTVQTLYAGEAATMQGIASIASASWKEGEPVFCYPYAALFYFLFRLKNPTPYDVLIWPMHTEQQFGEVRGLLQQSACRWLIVSRNEPLFGGEIPLERYFAEQYAVRQSFRYATVLERRR